MASGFYWGGMGQGFGQGASQGMQMNSLMQKMLGGMGGSPEVQTTNPFPDQSQGNILQALMSLFGQGGGTPPPGIGGGFAT